MYAMFSDRNAIPFLAETDARIFLQPTSGTLALSNGLLSTYLPMHAPEFVSSKHISQHRLNVRAQHHVFAIYKEYP